MRNHTPGSIANKDLYENRHLYEEEPPPTDQVLHVRNAFEGVVEAEDELRDQPVEGLVAMLGQYRKDLLFERDPQTKRDLRDHITAIEAEIECRKIDFRERTVSDTLIDNPEERLNARIDADAAWRRLTQRKRAA